MNPIVSALSLLTPFDIDKPKTRVGPDGDGGYVFVDDFRSFQAILSYGISTEYRFDEEMARRGHKVYMFDHTINQVNLSSRNMTWFKEGVGGRIQPDQRLYTIESHLDRHRIENDSLILKMDVEGAEWDAFNATPENVLARFDQIVLEIHGLENLGNHKYREDFSRALTKINNIFTLFHVHANNCDGENSLVIVEGFPIQRVLELSYVKSSLVNRTKNMTLYPTAFDYANADGRDCLLWYFPFAPTSLTFGDFALCESRVDLLEQLRLSASRR